MFCRSSSLLFLSCRGGECAAHFCTFFAHFCTFFRFLEKCTFCTFFAHFFDFWKNAHFCTFLHIFCTFFWVLENFCTVFLHGNGIFLDGSVKVENFLRDDVRVKIFPRNFSSQSWANVYSKCSGWCGESKNIVFMTCMTPDPDPEPPGQTTSSWWKWP